MPLVTATSTTQSLHVEWVVATAPEGLWAHITNPTLLPQWLGRHVDGCLTVGDVLKIDHGEGYVSSSRVHRVQPLEQFADSPRRVWRVFCWCQPACSTGSLRA